MVLALLTTVAWLIVLLHESGLISLAGLLPIGLYPLYSVAAATGWCGGALYVQLGRRTTREGQRQLRMVCLFGPAALPALLRAMTTASAQQQAPLVPLLLLAVTGVFFLVPVTLARGGTGPTAGSGGSG